jgi:hypothetical protein
MYNFCAKRVIPSECDNVNFFFFDLLMSEKIVLGTVVGVCAIF